MNTREFGRLGEAAAVKYLTDAGYHIIGTNVYVGHEEIDIIAEDGGYIVFVEVKTRRMTPDTRGVYGSPAEAVNAAKQRHLISAAEKYISENTSEKYPRIDVTEVYCDPASGSFSVTEIRHFENAVRKKSKFAGKSVYGT